MGIQNQGGKDPAQKLHLVYSEVQAATAGREFRTTVCTLSIVNLALKFIKASESNKLFALWHLTISL